MKRKSCGNIVLEDGSFHICATLTSGTIHSLKKDLQDLTINEPAVIEWRADYLMENLTEENIVEGLMLIRKTHSRTPLIFTLRKESEGGVWSLTEEELYRLRLCAAETGLLDLMDIEMSSLLTDTEKVFSYESLIRSLKSRRMLLILSYHDFTGVPDQDALIQIVQKMTEEDADITKIAVMVMGEEDMNLLKEVSTRLREEPGVPHILIGMGELGVETRYNRKDFSSALTYAYVGEKSAPGQISITDLKHLLEITKGE